MEPNFSAVENAPYATREIRYFTVAEANETLVFVRRVVRDAVATYSKLMELRSAHEEAALDPNTSTVAAQLREQVDEQVEHLRHLVHELDGVGCQFKDPVVGLVDFPALHEGRPICLCWKLDEPEVRFWHNYDAGFAGRRPIDSEFCAALASSHTLEEAESANEDE